MTNDKNIYNIKCKNCGKEEKVTNSSFNLCESCYNGVDIMSEKIETEFGTATINARGYYQIASRKEGNYKKYLHRLIYEREYGQIPDGYVIHHKNGNKLDNSLMNLQLMSEFEHLSLHMKGNKHNFNPYIRITKKIDKNCKQGYYWIASPSTKGKVKQLSSVDLDKCIKKVEDFINSEENTLGYTSYEVEENIIENNINNKLEQQAPSSSHYKKRVQPLDIIDAFELNFNMASALKYIARSKFKHQEISDINKAIYYLEREKNKILYK